MARFAAKYAKYRHGVRTGRFMVLADGQRQEIVKELFAKFEKDILTSDEVSTAAGMMIHSGLPIDRNTEQHVSPRHRISGFDSLRAQEFYGWTDEERELVEFALRNSPHLGDEFVELTKEPAVKPWPTYDSDSVEQVVAIARATGLIEAVLEYERENANRREVFVEFLDAPVAEEPAPVVIDA